MKRLVFTSVLILACLAAGCSSVPDAVQESLRGDLRDWRLVKKELVQPLPPGPEREVWLKRLAAFIARARANVAWAEEAEEFDVRKAFEEEVGRVEE
jgi:hypothetical protein